MKRILISVVVLSVLVACNGGGSKEEKKETGTEVADITTNPDYKKGLDILAKNDCLTCRCFVQCAVQRCTIQNGS